MLSRLYAFCLVFERNIYELDPIIGYYVTDLVMTRILCSQYRYTCGVIRYIATISNVCRRTAANGGDSIRKL